LWILRYPVHYGAGILMGKGLLAWWRQRIVARGLAGAALFAVPVAVAGLIGFGTSLSGVAGGLSAVTNGPDTAPASQPTSTSLSNAVVALAATSRTQPSSGGNQSAVELPSSSGSSTGTGTVSDTGTGTGGGSTGNGGNQGVISAPNPPVLGLPGGGGGGGGGNPGQDAVNGVGNGVNNVLGGVDNTLQGLLGGH
jgi:hypothetical protein